MGGYRSLLAALFIVAGGFGLMGCAQKDFFKAEETVAFKLDWPPAISYDGTKYYFISWDSRRRYTSGFIYDVAKAAIEPMHLPCGYVFLDFYNFSVSSGRNFASLVKQRKKRGDPDWGKNGSLRDSEIIVFDPTSGEVVRSLKSENKPISFSEVGESNDDQTLFVTESTYLKSSVYAFNAATGTYRYLYPPKSFRRVFKEITVPKFRTPLGYVAMAEIWDKKLKSTPTEFRQLIAAERKYKRGGTNTQYYLLFKDDGSIAHWDGDKDFLARTWFTFLTKSGAVSLKGNRKKLGPGGYSVTTYDGQAIKSIYDLRATPIRAWKVSRNERYLIVFARQDPVTRTYRPDEPWIARIIDMQTDTVVKDFSATEIQAAFYRFKQPSRCDG